MAYTALYRNFRPLKFSDMVGQEHITKTLRNQVMSGRVGHAYLFNGGRGTGKTTSAKILARVVNCLNPVEGEPCNECEICKDILDGSLTDVVEMDAASNNGVDDIRSIREEVNFLPTKAKYRVYIIDEVHMLSPGAFNALLKTLEEPPSHVKFILATTEPQKLPTTILSRCQRFDFKKIPENDIVKRLKIICESSDIKIDEEALKIMAVLSEGHMRDAISILERCSQENTEKISSDEVKELVGLPSLVHINKLARGILEYDTIGALAAVDDVLEDGKDLYNFLWEVIKYFKDILVYKTTNNLKLYSDAEIVEIKRLADITEEQRLLDIVYLLSELEADIKWSSQKTIMFQTGVIKACRKETASSTSTSYSGGTSLEKRLEILENKLANMKIGQDSTIAMQELENGIVEAPKVVAAPREKKETKQVQGVPSNTQEIWKRVIDAVKNGGKLRLFTALINSRINVLNDLIWEIEFPNGITSFNQKILDDVTNQNEIIKEIFKLTGKQINLRFKDGKAQNKPSGGASPEKPKEVKDLGFEINIIE
ncbi:MAG: DNA polymerase III subunit gamma/tau [Clostridia bacterium]|nr:DNA polymerase III subunit gamma/tau [Clostridia bacterium]